ncbi:MAG: ISC system 2Fe-2S type ferredoxin [Arsenophonus sp.]|nr:MAG: ISC system 2Fe-2S type ferredoxin [Arsenophonus sp.]
MPKIIFLPHKELCPNGVTFEAKKGESILNAGLRNNVRIEHVCEKSCVCTTCHCIIRKGFSSLEKSSEMEEDMLDKAWGVEEHSRLSCQAIIQDEDLIIEIPKYTINHIREQ